MWQGNNPPSTIHDVYDYVGRRLRFCKSRLLSGIERLFFGGVDPIQYLLHLEEIFKCKHRVRRIKSLTGPRIGGYRDLELFVGACSDVGPRPGLREAGFTKDLQTFSTSYRRSVELLAEMLAEVRGLWCIVQTFCQSLEGEFELKRARTTNVELRGALDAIEELLSQSERGVDVKLFSENQFSLEVAKTCDTVRFPVLRLFPDLFQKFHCVFRLLGKLRVNDQMYLDDVRYRLIQAKRIRRLKQEDYDVLELKLGEVLRGIVEKRLRVKCREMRDRIKPLESEVYKLTVLQRSMTAELSTTEQDIQERRKRIHPTNNDAVAESVSKTLAADYDLSIRKDLAVLSKKMKFLTKSLKLNDHDLNLKAQEKRKLEEEYEEMRESMNRSHRLGYERSELARDIALFNEKIKVLESIFYGKTDRQTLAHAYEGMQHGAMEA